ncbi:hypothetical protein CH92_08125 [Stutzerimonas stutzeri]|uniref:YjiS-like domain-containing protein n=1 Tax=Stutzerimonas stutzeri TaxID=316 RepID=W8QWU6_STUST|nr:DUF1127 domain-containing protein [Stutzerimonas stutzeri]AHL75070.1 hypothetical protein CH92_08125 [Stutzerimonas stutzeri]MCQ4328384.1 DUF1127 domain-containing protein [Stutzerimonas stutzeri]
MKSHVEFLKIDHLSTNRGTSLTALLREAWQRVSRWHALYRQRQQLAALSDDMLKDIGLSRADIETEANRPFWDEPYRRS